MLVCGDVALRNVERDVQRGSILRNAHVRGRCGGTPVGEVIDDRQRCGLGPRVVDRAVQGRGRDRGQRYGRQIGRAGHAAAREQEDTTGEQRSSHRLKHTEKTAPGFMPRAVLSDL